MPLDKEFYYRDFIYSAAVKLNDALKQLHLAYQKRNDYIIDMKDNAKYYQAIGIDLTPIYDINPMTRININKKNYNKLSAKLRGKISSYNYIVYEKIPLIKRTIHTYSAIHECSKEFYTPIWKYLTQEIAKQLLRGNAYSFGEQIGYIKVYITKFDSPLQAPCIQPSSWKLRQKLIESGATVKSKDNPNGAKWQIRRLCDWWIKARYRRYHKSIINSKYYRFKWGWTSDVGYENTPNYHEKDSFDEIINNSSMNFLNKLLTICFNFPDLKWEIYQNNINTNNDKNYDEQSIICK